MKLTESALRKIIKQEIKKALNEGKGHPLGDITRRIAALHDKTMAGDITEAAMLEMLKAVQAIEFEIQDLLTSGKISHEDYEDYLKNPKNFRGM